MTIVPLRVTFVKGERPVGLTMEPTATTLPAGCNRIRCSNDEIEGLGYTRKAFAQVLAERFHETISYQQEYRGVAEFAVGRSESYKGVEIAFAPKA